MVVVVGGGGNTIPGHPRSEGLGVKFHIVSSDPELLSLSRELASEFPQCVWTITLVTPLTVDLEADLCLWDYQPGLNLPSKANWGTKHFVLVDSGVLRSFCAAHPQAQPGIALKPLLRGVLRALIAYAVSTNGSQRAIDLSSSLRSDRDDILQCLMQANLCLQQHDQQRTNFLSRVVHDFQAPLTAISGYCSLLLQNELGPLNEQQTTVLQRMHHSASRLSRMTRSMLELSVGRHVNHKPVLTQGDLGECLDQALHEVSPFLQEKQIKIEIDLDPPPFEFLFEPATMIQLLVNLLENASKFTPRLGLISVTAYPSFFEWRSHSTDSLQQGDRRRSHVEVFNSYRLDVKDSGPGIAAAHMSSIFEDYVSYAGDGNAGSGLGLAVCRMVMQRHGGKIWVENSPEGAVFSCVFPVQMNEKLPMPQRLPQTAQRV